MDASKNKEKENLDKDSIQPEPETLNTTDPQDNMEGPVSSLTKKSGENFETAQTKKDADKEKDDKM